MLVVPQKLWIQISINIKVQLVNKYCNYVPKKSFVLTF